MRKRTLSPRPQANKKTAHSLKVATRVAVTCILVFSAAVYACVLLSRLPYFLVKDVLIKESFRGNDAMDAMYDPPKGSIDLGYLKGRNIFGINMPQEAGRILANNPQYKKVRVIKVFPNRLFVHCLKRTAVAIVRLRRDYFVGEDLALSLAAANVDLAKTGLPVIVGLENKLGPLRPQEKYYVPELMFAVAILRELRKNLQLRQYSVEKIDIAVIENTSLFIRMPFAAELAGKGDLGKKPYSLLEVKIGQDNLLIKTALLGELFGHYREKLSLLEYIDLRFKEPVIKLRNEKK